MIIKNILPVTTQDRLNSNKSSEKVFYFYIYYHVIDSESKNRPTLKNQTFAK